MTDDPAPDDPAAVAHLLRERASDELWIVARGPSMRPLLHDGVRLLVGAFDRRPRVGEVWVYVAASGAVIAHRVMLRRPGGRFVLFGDSDLRADSSVPIERMVGQVVTADDDGTRFDVTGRSFRPVLAMFARVARRRALSVVR